MAAQQQPGHTPVAPAPEEESVAATGEQTQERDQRDQQHIDLQEEIVVVETPEPTRERQQVFSRFALELLMQMQDQQGGQQHIDQHHGHGHGDEHHVPEEFQFVTAGTANPVARSSQEFQFVTVGTASPVAMLPTVGKTK